MDGSGESRCDCVELAYSVRASSLAGGGLGAGLKRLAMPETTMPGWRPSSGASREMVPTMRWRKGDVLYGLWLGYRGSGQLVSRREV